MKRLESLEVESPTMRSDLGERLLSEELLSPVKLKLEEEEEGGLFVPSSLCHGMSIVGQVAIPAALCLSFSFMSSVITLKFVGGYKDSEHLPGTGLALSSISVCLALAIGVLEAMVTLVPQAMGDGNLRMVSALLQRGLVVAACLTLVCGGLLAATPSIFRVAGQDKDVVEDCATVVHYTLIGLLPLLLYYALQLFLQGQNILWPIVFVLGSSLFVQYGLAQVLVYGAGSWGGVGWEGAPLAQALTRFYQLFALVLAVAVGKYTKDTWFGWDMRAMFDWQGLKVFVQLGTHSGLSVFAEAFGYELLTIISGYLGSSELAAMALVSQVYMLFWFTFLGINIAASIVVGHLMGDGKPAKAKLAAQSSLLLTFLASLGTGLLFFLASEPIAHLLSSNSHVRSLAKEAFKVAAAVHIIDVFQNCEAGILMGLGKPKRSAVVNLITYYFVCIPLGAVLAWYAHMRLVGLWLALGCGLSVVCIIHFTWFMWLADWAGLSSAAKQRSDDERARLGSGADVEAS